MALAIAIFVGALALIASERFDRTKIALLGAVLVLVTQTIDQEHAIESIDFNTIGLLAGMMLLVRLTETDRRLQLAGDPRRSTLARPTARGRGVARRHDRRALGVPGQPDDGAADGADHVPARGRARHRPDPAGDHRGDRLEHRRHRNADRRPARTSSSPARPICPSRPSSRTSRRSPWWRSSWSSGLLYLAYRSKLQIAPKSAQAGPGPRRCRLDRGPRRAAAHRPDPAGTILLFFFHQALGLEPATVALAGATAALLVTRQPLEDALRGIEWPTLFFFIGLFVMVGALEETGAIGEVADAIASVTGGDRTAELLGIAWLSAIGSGIVDNIPFTTTMIPVVEQLQQGNDGDDAYWWALALGACFGGNATLVAAAANVAASGMAARAGKPIGFVQFLKAGLPATLISMVLATGYIAIRYL